MANLETVYNFIKKNNYFKHFNINLDEISIDITVDDTIRCLGKQDLQELYLVMSMFFFFDYSIHTHNDKITIRIWVK